MIITSFLILLSSQKVLGDSETYPDYNGEFYFRSGEKAFKEGMFSEARSYYLTVALNYDYKPFAKLAKEKSEKCWDIIKNSRELNIIEEKKKEGVIEVTYEINNNSKRKLLVSYYIKKGIFDPDGLSKKAEYLEYDVYLKPGQKVTETYLILRRFFWDEGYKIGIKETMFLNDNENIDANAKPIKWGSIYQGELKLLETLREKNFNKLLAEWEKENKSKQFKINIIKAILIIGVITGIVFVSVKIIRKRNMERTLGSAMEVISEKELYGGEVEFLNEEKYLRDREFEKALNRGEPDAIVKFFQREFPLVDIFYWNKRNILTLRMEIAPFNYSSKENISIREMGLNYRSQILNEAMLMVYKVFDIRVVENFVDIVRVEFLSNFVDKYGRPLKGCILSLEATRREAQKIVRQNFDINNSFEIFNVYYQTDDNYRPRKVISHREIDEQRHGISENKIEQLEETLGLNIENLFEPEYENLIKVFLENLGFSIGDSKKVGDEGIYITAYCYQPILKGKYIIYVRNHTKFNFVEVGEVRELFGIIIHELAQKGILISSTDFTNEAAEFAKGKPLELINRKSLEMLLQKHVDRRYLNKMNLMVVK